MAREPEDKIAWNLKHANKEIYLAEEEAAEQNLEIRKDLTEIKEKLVETLQELEE